MSPGDMFAMIIVVVIVWVTALMALTGALLIVALIRKMLAYTKADTRDSADEDTDSWDFAVSTGS